MTGPPRDVTSSKPDVSIRRGRVVGRCCVKRIYSAVRPLYPNIIPESAVSSALTTPIPGHVQPLSVPHTQVTVQILRNNQPFYPQESKPNIANSKMFIGRVYENQKKNKQSTNNRTYNEQTVKKQSRSRSRSVSDEDVDEDMERGKDGKNFRNMKKSRQTADESPDETDRESEQEDYVPEPKTSGKESERTFMERINDRVKKLKKEKVVKEPTVKKPQADSKQTVYSITSTDVEKGIKKGKLGKSAEKFESIELDSGDEKKQLGGGGGGRGERERRGVREEGPQSVAVQATPYPPFRLRMLPHPDWQESESTVLKVVRLVVCQAGLACIVLAWALMGALVFHLTEAPREQSQVWELNRRQTELVVGLATDLRQVVPEEPVWRSTIEEYAAHHEALILSAVSSGYPQRGTIWTYPGCLLFATSLLTTLGFGAPVPRTVTGRVSAIVFAGLGVPVHFLLILNFGLLVAVKLHHFARVLQKRAARLHKTIATRGKSKEEEWPSDIFTPESPPPPPSWISCFPFIAIPLYYCMGLLLFGVLRSKPFPEVMLFPLDFTSAGGVAGTPGALRVAYAIYLEGAVILASTNVALLRSSATRGFTTMGIRLGIMINHPK